MKRKTFLVLSAMIAFSVGLFALVLPGVLLASKGAASSPVTEVWIREVGVLLLATAAMVFGMRAHPDSATLRVFLLGNIGVQLGLLPIEIAAFAQQTISSLGGIVPNSIVHVFLACGFAYYARRVRVGHSNVCSVA
jgi:hypothetical protein